MLFSFITMPTVATMTAQITTYATGFFDELLTPALAVVGIIGGVLLLKFLIMKVPLGAVKSFIGGRRGGRRRR